MNDFNDIDYTSYLSYDNNFGILLNKSDKFILEQYKIKYDNCTLQELIFNINEYIEDNILYDIEDLEEVLSNLMEIHYYNETNK